MNLDDLNIKPAHDPAAIPPKPDNSWRWATVISTDPLQVRLDGETTPLSATPSNVAGALYFEDRVWVQQHGRSLIVLGSGAARRRQEQFRYAATAQTVLSGGGTLTTASGGAGWSERFLVMGAGKGPSGAPESYFDIEVPGASTSIPVIGTERTANVLFGMIELQPWDNLFYDLPIGGSSASDPSRFFVAGFDSPEYVLPESAVFIVGRRADPKSLAYVWGTGAEQDYFRDVSFINWWGNRGAPNHTVAYLRTPDQRVHLRGVMQGGTASNAFSVPVSVAPSRSTMFSAAGADASTCRVAIQADGKAYVTGQSSTGDLVSLDGISWSLGT